MMEQYLPQRKRRQEASCENCGLAKRRNHRCKYIAGTERKPNKLPGLQEVSDTPSAEVLAQREIRRFKSEQRVFDLTSAPSTGTIVLKFRDATITIDLSKDRQS